MSAHGLASTPALLALLSALVLAPGCSPATADKTRTGPSGADDTRKEARPTLPRAQPLATAVKLAPPAEESLSPVAAADLTARPTAPPGASPPRDLPASNATADPRPFPSAVTAFMVDRDGCDHFRGEEAYDDDRRAFLEDSIRQLCTGTDTRLAALRKRYAGDPDVTAALANYEDEIETVDEP
jgi:hypothetical protein